MPELDRQKYSSYIKILIKPITSIHDKIAKLANIPIEHLDQAAQQYSIHAVIHAGYMNTRGGTGTVKAMVIAHEMLIIHAVISMQNRSG